MPRTKQRTPDLRDHVLAVAVGLLAEEGVAGFTTRGVARRAGTSTPAVYELFGDKWGLVRHVFFEGFRLLALDLETLEESPDPGADLVELVRIYRRFLRDNPELAEIMFSRPFTDFDPGPSERQASASVRTFILGQVDRSIEAGLIGGDPTDVAHILVALVQGLANAENARRLGTTAESIDRRWDLAVRSLLDGLAP
jgi:AcrR family transcriptional regulator